jgi:ankyrin repeat protein
MAELTQRTLVLMCGKHRLHSRYDSDQECEVSNCTAVQRRASVLLNRGGRTAAVSELDSYGKETPLGNLAASGCAACVKHFIEQLGADVTVVFGNNSTALHAAAKGGCGDVVELLLQAGADVHAQTTAGNTAVHTAASGDHSDVVELLLRAGADKHAKTTAGDTALHKAVAVSNASSSTVKALLTADKNSAPQQEQQQQQSLLAQQDSNGCTALHLAVGTDRLSGYKIERLKVLLKHSSTKDSAASLAVSDQHGNTVLHYAVAKSCATETLELLLAACTRVGALQQLLILPDAAGLTPLRTARVYSDAAVVDVLQRYTNQVSMLTYEVTCYAQCFTSF